MFTHGSLNVFARKSNVNIHNRFVTFGLKNLGKEMKRIATLIASELIRSRIEYNSKGVLVPSGKRKKTRKLVATNVIVDEFQIITQEELGREIFDNLYRTVRKQGGIMTCLTQTLSDNLLQAEMQAMLSNSEFIVLLNQSGIDRNILKQIYPEISEEEIRYVTNAKVGSGLIKCGDKVVPFDCELPKDNLESCSKLRKACVRCESTCSHNYDKRCKVSDEHSHNMLQSKRNSLRQRYSALKLVR